MFEIIKYYLSKVGQKKRLQEFEAGLENDPGVKQVVEALKEGVDVFEYNPRNMEGFKYLNNKFEYRADGSYTRPIDASDFNNSEFINWPQYWVVINYHNGDYEYINQGFDDLSEAFEKAKSIACEDRIYKGLVASDEYTYKLNGKEKSNSENSNKITIKYGVKKILKTDEIKNLSKEIPINHQNDVNWDSLFEKYKTYKIDGDEVAVFKLFKYKNKMHEGYSTTESILESRYSKKFTFYVETNKILKILGYKELFSLNELFPHDDNGYYAGGLD